MPPVFSEIYKDIKQLTSVRVMSKMWQRLFEIGLKHPPEEHAFQTLFQKAFQGVSEFAFQDFLNLFQVSCFSTRFSRS